MILVCEKNRYSCVTRCRVGTCQGRSDAAHDRNQVSSISMPFFLRFNEQGIAGSVKLRRVIVANFYIFPGDTVPCSSDSFSPAAQGFGTNLPCQTLRYSIKSSANRPLPLYKSTPLVNAILHGNFLVVGVPAFAHCFLQSLSDAIGTFQLQLKSPEGPFPLDETLFLGIQGLVKPFLLIISADDFSLPSRDVALDSSEFLLQISFELVDCKFLIRSMENIRNNISSAVQCNTVNLGIQFQDTFLGMDELQTKECSSLG